MDAPSMRSKRRSRTRAEIQGNDVLYHYFQKTLLEQNPGQFREITIRLILALGVWFSPVLISDTRC
jgi:hypothetical protein